MRCSVCYSIFSIENPPFVLNCGHSYHSDCIQKFQTCSCPDCRTQIISANKNILATALLEKMEEETSMTELIEKFEEASEMYIKKMKDISELKKEIKDLNLRKEEIVLFYEKQKNDVINSGYIKIVNLMSVLLEKHTKPFKNQIDYLIRKKEKYIKNKNQVFESYTMC